MKMSLEDMQNQPEDMKDQRMRMKDEKMMRLRELRVQEVNDLHSINIILFFTIIYQSNKHNDLLL